ncbi:MAG: iron chaperone [Betaproteobacteria bacterium]
MPPATIDDYLAGLALDQRAALDQLRQQIRAAVPDVTETIAYGAPGFRLDGRYFVGFAAGTTQCSFYTGRAPIVALADELTAYRVWKGTINFRPEKPLPAGLVTRLLAIRVAEFRTG